MKLIVEGTNEADEEWDVVVEALTQYMQKINPEGYWTAEVKNFGWRSVDGSKDVFYADNGEKLLFAILPNTECSFKIYKYKKTGIAINNAHHDKPMGGEWYYIKKAKRG